jgi:hypothetical protein
VTLPTPARAAKSEEESSGIVTGVDIKVKDILTQFAELLVSEFAESSDFWGTAMSASLLDAIVDSGASFTFVTDKVAANLIRSRATTHFKRFYSISKRLNPRRRCSLRVLMGFPFAHSRDHVPWRTTVAKWNITQDPAPSTPQQKKNKTRISPVSRRCTHDPHRSRGTVLALSPSATHRNELCLFIPGMW